MELIDRLLRSGYSLVKNGHYLSYDDDGKTFEIYVTDLGGYFVEEPVKTGTLEACLEYMKTSVVPEW